MGTPDPILLLTRPEPQSRAFLTNVAARLRREPAAIVSPIINIVSLNAAPDLDAYRTLIVTSGNAVAVTGRALDGRSVVTVGARTAAKAREAGARAVCLGADVEAFLARIGEIKGPALHLRGTHSRGDLAARARAAGVRVDECVLYDQAEQALTAEAREALETGRALVPLFSPRSAAILSRYPRHPDTRAVALSRAVADAWGGTRACAVAVRPDREAMLDLVAAALGQGAV